MKKVAIVTITNSGLNFGNRLQNYALQEQLKQKGIYVETIISSNVCKNSILLSRLRRQVKKIIKNDKRRQYFNRFNREHIQCAKRIRYGNLNEKKFSNQYDAFIAGSDQVWNPNFHFNSDFEFLTFAPSHKRYSYAASFGVDEINEENIEKYTDYLNKMRMISVREDRGAKIVENLIGKRPQIHIDPTMLLPAEKYYEIEECPEQCIPNQYLLTYFLGDISESYKKFIQSLAKTLDLEVVELSETKNSNFYHMGPQQFIYLVHHANYICTDSFHGSVFSILFEKQFSIFPRQDKDVPMNSRIETLVNKFALTSRVVYEKNLKGTPEAIDYLKVNTILDREREKAQSYFDEISQQWE